MVFTAFAFKSGAVSIDSMVSTPFAPTILAWMFARSISGPLSIQSCMPCAPTHAWGCPLIRMMSSFAASQPDRTSAVPWTNSAFSAMYSSPQLMTSAPRPTENATRRIVATSGVIPFRVSNNPIGHRLFNIITACLLYIVFGVFWR